jgi:hypothetical protein
MYEILAGPIGRTRGYEVERIAPDDVVKTAKGDIHVMIRMTLNGVQNYANLFTSKDECDELVKENKLTPEQAAPGDIN